MRREGGRHYFIPFLFAGHPQKLETSHAATQSEAGKIHLFISFALKMLNEALRSSIVKLSLSFAGSCLEGQGLFRI